MYPAELVFGLLNTSERINDPQLSSKLRSFTISWSRYGYRGRLIEHAQVNLILDEAAALGYKWCLVQGYGSVLSERWSHGSSDGKPLEIALREWLADKDFFVTGRISGNSESGYGLDDQFLLVNLESYVAFGRPAFDRPVSGPVESIQPAAVYFQPPENNRISTLIPSSETTPLDSPGAGWNFIDVGLRNHTPIYGFGPEIDSNQINLTRGSRAQLAHFSGYLDQNIFNYSPGNGQSDLSVPQQVFLDLVHQVVSNSRHGVFLWNLEPYDDVKVPPTGFRPPISTLYSVAAGFKPNFILESFGFDEATRVVFFDYSLDALKVRQRLTEEWDGDDLPHFIQYLFREFPYPETFYFLWSGYNPNTVPVQDLYEFWELELEKWGGQSNFKNHWTAYKKLTHEYVHCNVLTQAGGLLSRVKREPNAVIWWSNLFFTMYSNWFFTVEERRKLYERWIGELAAKNPEVFIDGSDYNNISVNHIRVGDYQGRFATGGANDLDPVKINQVEIRF